MYYSAISLVRGTVPIRGGVVSIVTPTQFQPIRTGSPHSPPHRVRYSTPAHLLLSTHYFYSSGVSRARRSGLVLRLTSNLVPVLCRIDP